MPTHPPIATTETNFNVKATLSKNRLLGLWRLLRGYQMLYVGAIAALGISALANTGSLLLLREVIGLFDPAKINESFTNTLLWLSGAFLVLSVIRGYFAFVSGDWASRVAEAISLRVRDFMFDHLQHLPFTYHDKMQTGELIQRSTSDNFAIKQFFAEQAIGVGRIIILFIVNFAALLWLHVPLALFSVIVVPIVVILSIFFFKKVGDAYEKFQLQDEKVSTALQENLSGVRVVKAFARQNYEIERFDKENKAKTKLGMDFMFLHSIYWPFTDLLTGFQLLFGYMLGAFLAMAGEGNTTTILGITLQGISIGTFISYMAMISWIINPIRNLGRLIVQMTTGMVSYNRVAEVFGESWEDLGKGETAPVSDIKGNLVFKHLNFRYGDGPEVLHDIDFEVKEGQTIALLGSTGSGKTTLMSLLTRFYNYSDGSITLEGVELNKFPRAFLRENIGVVQQEPFLFSASIRDNIKYGLNREVTDEEVYAAARIAAVHEVVEEFPKGYDTMVGERGVTLSGGQKQRVALARTLLKNPRILILDDATSSVDTETESQIREALDGMMKNRTSFVIAHRIQSVMNADLILVLDKGKIVQRGTHESLMEEDGIYRRTYDMQARIETELEQEIASV